MTHGHLRHDRWDILVDGTLTLDPHCCANAGICALVSPLFVRLRERSFVLTIAVQVIRCCLRLHRRTVWVAGVYFYISTYIHTYMHVNEQLRVTTVSVKSNIDLSGALGSCKVQSYGMLWPHHRDPPWPHHLDPLAL